MPAFRDGAMVGEFDIKVIRMSARQPGSDLPLQPHRPDFSPSIRYRSKEFTNVAILKALSTQRRYAREGCALGYAQEMSVVAARVKTAQRGEFVIETAKALPGLIKDWTSNRDLLYQYAGCVAGVLTITSYVRRQRPSEALADLFNTVGLPRVGAWLESGLPRFLAQPNAQSSHALVQLAGLTVLLMLLTPFIKARRNKSRVKFEASCLLGARAASTTWILLMFAVQLGSLQWGINWLLSTSLASMAVTALGLVVLLVLYVIARRLCLEDLIAPVGNNLSWVGTLGCAVVGMAALALMLVIIGPALSLGSWLFSTESDAHHRTQ